MKTALAVKMPGRWLTRRSPNTNGEVGGGRWHKTRGRWQVLPPPRTRIHVSSCLPETSGVIACIPACLPLTRCLLACLLSCIRMHACVPTCIHASIYTYIHDPYVCVDACVCACMHARMLHICKWRDREMKLETERKTHIRLDREKDTHTSRQRERHTYV